MKRLLTLFVIVALVLVATLALPAMVAAVPVTTVYDQDEAGWKAAVGTWLTEDFADATLNTGLSVVTDNGLVQAASGCLATSNVWWDRLIPGSATTTWTFDVPITAFGGNWDLGGPGGPGTGIAVEINGSWVPVGEIDSDVECKFWGFVSDTAFTQVRFIAGTDPQGWAETYELDNMVYSAHTNGYIIGGGIVEPALVASSSVVQPFSDFDGVLLAAAGAIVLGFWYARRRGLLRRNS